jgi:glucose/arabinose dehydrogenase
MNYRSLSAAIVFGVTLLMTASLNAAFSGTTRFASGLSAPTFATFAPGDSTHLFVIEKGGNIKVVDLVSKTVLSTPFLNIPDTDAANEGGLVGLAFNPDYNKIGTPGFGKFYAYVTVDNGGLPVTAGTAATATSPFSTHIRQYSVSSNPYVATPTATEIMSWARPEDNHVGGWIGFSPKDTINRYLYIDSGDGGLSNDSGAGHYEPGGNAQNITSDLMGKQLRIDVTTDGFPSDANKNYTVPPKNPFVGTTGDDEIWSYGLRNPFRASFDRDTGDMWIADVGQDFREEIDVQAASAFNTTGQATAANYGWRLREGKIATPSGGVGGAAPAGAIEPVYDYTHGSGSLQGNAVIGGFVYRGPDPSIQGVYIFGDEVSSHYFEMNTTTHAVINIDGLLTPNVGSLTAPSSFVEDPVGNLYIVTYGSGSIFKINTTQFLPGDYDQDGDVDADDYTVWRSTFGSTGTGLAADGNHNSVVDEADYVLWRNNLGSTVHTSGSSVGTAVPESTTLLYACEIGVFAFALLPFQCRRAVCTINM